MAPRLTPYQDLVVSEDAYDNARKKEKMGNFENLKFDKDKKDKGGKAPKFKTTGSDWNRKHLFACHVVVRSKGLDLLPVYRKVDITKLPDLGGKIKLFEEGPQKNKRLEHHMLQENGFDLGLIWTALDNVKVPKSVAEHMPSPTKNTIKRDRRPRATAAAAPKYTAPPESSQEAPPSSPLSRDESFKVAMDEAELRSELHVVTLAVAVIRHIVAYSQPLAAQTGFGIREELGVDLTVKGNLLVNAIDDGGIRYQSLIDGKIDNFIALLEAKKLLQIKTEEGQAYVPDRNLAQMAYEAIMARSKRGRQSSESVVIIYAARIHFCFLQFNVSNGFLDAFLKGETPTDELTVHMTKFFNLDHQPGRQGLAKNVRHLIGMAKEQMSSK
uniref:WGS project CBMI000000000 data, contig CS3069_c004142 n=1 Tax=Fusarium clavum TaxID=2594811 RepID=A0A090N614_9HYPO|nr:unnamed protein product [Fusarium clavum]